MYSIKEFSKLIRVSVSTLRNWDSKGLLKPIRLPSGHRRYTDSDLEKIKGTANNEK
jgi:DNA-binding transcriptional MerR regulator